MDNEINLTLIKQLKNLFNFSEEELLVFFNEFKSMDIDEKKKLLFDLDLKINENKDFESSLNSKIKIKINEIEEYLEKQNVNIDL